MSFLKSKQSLIILFLIAIFILSLPYFFRLANGNHIFIGGEPHYHARIASEIAKNGFINKDPLIGSKYIFNPYHFVLAASSFIIPVEFVSIFLPVLLGLLSILFLFLALNDLKLKYLNSWFVVLIFVFSPIYMSIFSFSTPKALITLLLILTFYLFQKKSYFYFILSLITLSLLAISGIIHAILALLFLLTYCFYKKQYLNRFYIALIVVLFVLLAFYLPAYLSGIIPSSGSIIPNLSSIYGFSIFLILLSMVGLFFVWKHKKTFYKAYLLMIGILFISLVSNYLLIYSNLIISFLAGSAFYALYVRKWKLKPLRNFALLVIFCGFLFSALSYSIILSKTSPNDDLVQCLEWINENSDAKSRILTHQSDGFFVEFWAERPALIDDFNTNDRLAYNVNVIWNSFDIQETRELLENYNIDYILTHEDFFNGLVWSEKGKGLYFLFNNAETFKRRYHNTYCEVWEYVYKGD